MTPRSVRCHTVFDADDARTTSRSFVQLQPSSTPTRLNTNPPDNFPPPTTGPPTPPRASRSSTIAFPLASKNPPILKVANFEPTRLENGIPARLHPQFLLPPLSLCRSVALSLLSLWSLLVRSIALLPILPSTLYPPCPPHAPPPKSSSSHRSRRQSQNADRNRHAPPIIAATEKEASTRSSRPPPKRKTQGPEEGFWNSILDRIVFRNHRRPAAGRPTWRWPQNRARNRHRRPPAPSIPEKGVVLEGRETCAGNEVNVRAAPGAKAPQSAGVPRQRCERRAGGRASAGGPRGGLQPRSWACGSERNRRAR